MKTAKDVLKSIKDNDVKYVDLRFTDPRGKWQHVTFDVGMIEEDTFAEGVMFDGSSIAGWKAINESDVGLNPSNDGNLIRLAVPELTEERRHELVKIVRNLAEEGRVAIRNVRRDTMQHLRELKSDGEASSDDEHRAEVELQKLTDEKVGELDGVLKAKEQEILEV